MKPMMNRAFGVLAIASLTTSVAFGQSALPLPPASLAASSSTPATLPAKLPAKGPVAASTPAPETKLPSKKKSRNEAKGIIPLPAFKGKRKEAPAKAETETIVVVSGPAVTQEEPVEVVTIPASGSPQASASPTSFMGQTLPSSDDIYLAEQEAKKNGTTVAAQSQTQTQTQTQAQAKPVATPAPALPAKPVATPAPVAQATPAPQAPLYGAMRLAGPDAAPAPTPSPAPTPAAPVATTVAPSAAAPISVGSMTIKPAAPKAEETVSSTTMSAAADAQKPSPTPAPSPTPSTAEPAATVIEPTTKVVVSNSQDERRFHVGVSYLGARYSQVDSSLSDGARTINLAWSRDLVIDGRTLEGRLGVDLAFSQDLPLALQNTRTTLLRADAVQKDGNSALTTYYGLGVGYADIYVRNFESAEGDVTLAREFVKSGALALIPQAGLRFKVGSTYVDFAAEYLALLGGNNAPMGGASLGARWVVPF